MKKYTLILILLLISFTQISCIYKDIVANVEQSKFTNHSISGKVEFPHLNVKASTSDIAFNATISLIYPNNHPSLPNTTIITGLTDSNGNFIINFSNTLNINNGDIFVLEAVRRIGGTGNNTVSLRTNIEWNSTGWNSITTPGININSKTTAICIISDYNNFNSADLIGKVTFVNGISTLSSINNITVLQIQEVSDLVTQAISKNIDPVGHLNHQDGNYFITD